MSSALVERVEELDEEFLSHLPSSELVELFLVARTRHRLREEELLRRVGDERVDAQRLRDRIVELESEVAGQDCMGPLVDGPSPELIPLSSS